MSMISYIHFVIETFLFLGILVMWFRWSRPAKEDPRLSRGLQLLQSKISILEDLSDRTDAQVKQMCKLLERKGAQVQESILHAKDVISQIEQSIHESLEVADIFQDKIPHAEIIERESSKKYIEAARLAHQGLSPEEIAKRIDLDIAEIEFIAKINKDRLMFEEEELPNWAKTKPEKREVEWKVNQSQSLAEDFGTGFEKAFAKPDLSLDHMQELGKKFREACDDAKLADEHAEEMSGKLKRGLSGAIQSVLQPIDDVRSAIKTELSKNSEPDYLADGLDWEIEEDQEISQAIDKAMNKIEPANSMFNENNLQFEEEAPASQTRTLDIESQMDREDREILEAAMQTKKTFTERSQAPLASGPVVSRPKEQSKAPNFATPKAQESRVTEQAKPNYANNHIVSRDSSHGRVTVISREDNLKKNSPLFNKNLESIKNENIPAQVSKPSLLEQVRLRAKERVASGHLKMKVKKAEDSVSIQQLDFPRISSNKDFPLI